MGKSLAILFLVISQNACPVFSPCERSIASQVTSPDGRFVAILSLRVCGTHTGYDSIVSVNPSNDSLNRKGDVFIVNGDREMQLIWKGNSAIRVVCDTCEAKRILRKESSVHGVLVTYE